MPKESSAPEPPVAIVFTDIVKSTMLWETDSTTMTTAMAIHDDLIRRLCRLHRGYEVKQNGDGFMIAFQSASDTLRFCLDVQTELQKQKWPTSLLDLKPGKPIVEKGSHQKGREDEEGGTVLWKGLRLRIAVHFGKPVCKWNETIGRMDYLGPAVNRAARFVGVCEGGQIVVSEEFLGELKKAQTEAACRRSQPPNSFERTEDDYEIRLLGERQLSGISEAQKLYFVIPRALLGRLEYFPKKRYVQGSKGNLLENR